MINLKTVEGKKNITRKFDAMFANLKNDPIFYKKAKFKQIVAFDAINNPYLQYNLDIEVSEKSSCEEIIKAIIKKNPFSQLACEFALDFNTIDFIISASVQSLQNLGCGVHFLNDTDTVELVNEGNTITFSSNFSSDLGIYIVVCEQYCLNRLDYKINYDLAKYVGSIKGNYNVVGKFENLCSLNGKYGVFTLGNLIIFSNSNGCTV